MVLPNTSLPSTRGFTLLEMLVVLAILVSVLSCGLIFGMDEYRGTLSRAERTSLVTALTTARSEAVTGKAHAAHGVCVRGADLVIFQGVHYHENDPMNEIVEGNDQADIELTEPATFKCNENAESGIVFSENTGTTTGGTLTVTEPGRPPSIVEVNYEGTILW